MTLRVLMVANKNWECEPMVGVLAGKRPAPESLEKDAPFYPVPIRLSDKEVDTWKPGEKPAPANSDGVPTPRLRLTSKAKTYAPRPEEKGTFTQVDWNMEVELWCIEDWMTNGRLCSSSSSADKFDRALPAIHECAFRFLDGGRATTHPPDLVIALGTAGMPSQEIVNGCVVIGSRVFVSDPYWKDAGAAKKRRESGVGLDRMLDLTKLGLPAHPDIDGVARADDGGLDTDVFRKVPDAVRFAELCFLAPPVHAAAPLRIFAGAGFGALSTVNVVDYDDYVWTDALTRDRFARQIHAGEIGSMESTHGLIRATWPRAGFLYMSGITDRIPTFNQEVTPRLYAQNFACAHNMGVAAAFLLPVLFEMHRKGKLLAPVQTAPKG